MTTKDQLYQDREWSLDSELKAALQAATRELGDCLSFQTLMKLVFDRDELDAQECERLEQHVDTCYRCAATHSRLTLVVFEPSHWSRTLASFLRDTKGRWRDTMSRWRAVWINSTPPQPFSGAELAAAGHDPEIADELHGPAAAQSRNASLVLAQTQDGRCLRLDSKVRQRPVVLATYSDDRPPDVVLPSADIWDSLIEQDEHREVNLPERFLGQDVTFIALGLAPQATVRVKSVAPQDLLEMAAREVEGWEQPTSDGARPTVTSIYVLPSVHSSRQGQPNRPYSSPEGSL